MGRRVPEVSVASASLAVSEGTFGVEIRSSSRHRAFFWVLRIFVTTRGWIFSVADLSVTVTTRGWVF